MTSISLVTDIDAPPEDDNPGTGGAFDNAAYFQNKLADPTAVSACTDRIETSATHWAQTTGLDRSFRERQTTSLVLHYVKPGMPGLFALNYTVTERVKARVRVDYFSLNGTKQSPEIVKELISTYQIAAFQDDLDKALICGGTP